MPFSHKRGLAHQLARPLTCSYNHRCIWTC